MNPLWIVLAVLGGGFVLLNRSKKDSGSAGTKQETVVIPANTPAGFDVNNYFVPSAEALLLRASAAGDPAQLFSFAGVPVVVTVHLVSRTVGTPLTQYLSQIGGGGKHYVAIVDPALLNGAATGQSEGARIVVAESTELRACFAFYNFLKSSNPSLRIIGG